jgi:hypothetical protein
MPKILTTTKLTKDSKQEAMCKDNLQDVDKVREILYRFEQRSHTARIDALSEEGLTMRLVRELKAAQEALNQLYADRFEEIVDDICLHQPSTALRIKQQLERWRNG